MTRKRFSLIKRGIDSNDVVVEDLKKMLISQEVSYQQEGSLQTGGVQRNRGNSGPYKLKIVQRELLQLRKESHIAKDYWCKKKSK